MNRLSGAYEIEIVLSRSAQLRIGSLGMCRLPRGRYVYVGSARGGLEPRVGRHLRLAETKRGGGRWHVDALLRLPQARIAAVRLYPGRDECDLSREVAARPGATVPIPRFGAMDCRGGCQAHLYRMRNAECGMRNNVKD
ncbi:MAG: GIY-YIG nuclease family protein [Candidatus Sumerlaeota bacterium]|nr:GIY-YIG nuclease family protein [Candidatus Sumerlaeota bacterium]